MIDESRSPWIGEGPLGSTPLHPGEVDGLIPTWIASRGDLNEAEQANILDALRRRRWQLLTPEQLLDDLVVRKLHQEMFGDVWAWAGRYRTAERNIGVDPRTIAVCVRDLIEDTKFWIAGSNPKPLDEAAYTFHHRLVQIHPFPNGNGRHSRAMTDLLLRSLGASSFSWGSLRLDGDSASRADYIAGLRAADRGDFGPLAAFVRS